MWVKRMFKRALIAAPLVSNFLISIVFNGAQDYRYTYQVFLCFPVIFLFFLLAASKMPCSQIGVLTCNENDTQKYS